MFNARTTNLLRLGTLVWIAVSIGALFLAYTGIGTGWIAHNVSCGADGEAARACAPGEAQHVMMITGWISLAASVVELGWLSMKARGFSAMSLSA